MLKTSLIQNQDKKIIQYQMIDNNIKVSTWNIRRHIKQVHGTLDEQHGTLGEQHGTLYR